MIEFGRPPEDYGLFYVIGLLFAGDPWFKAWDKRRPGEDVRKIDESVPKEARTRRKEYRCRCLLESLLTARGLQRCAVQEPGHYSIVPAGYSGPVPEDYGDYERNELTQALNLLRFPGLGCKRCFQKKWPSRSNLDNIKAVTRVVYEFTQVSIGYWLGMTTRREGQPWVFLDDQMWFGGCLMAFRSLVDGLFEGAGCLREHQRVVKGMVRRFEEVVRPNRASQ